MPVPERWEPPPLSHPAETTRFEHPEPEVILPAPRRVPQPNVGLPPPVAAPAIAPNWYPDPTSPGLMRYWDGARWTDQRAAPTPQATAVVYNNVQVHGRGGGDSLLGLHIVLTILTCGAWLPIWLLIEIIKAIAR